MANHNNCRWDSTTERHGEIHSGNGLRKRAHNQKGFDPAVFHSDEGNSLTMKHSPPVSTRGKSMNALVRRHKKNQALGYDTFQPSHKAESSRIFPGYTHTSSADDFYTMSRRSEVSSFTNRPTLGTGDFPCVASKSLHRPMPSAPLDEEFTSGLMCDSKKRCRYTDDEDCESRRERFDVPGGFKSHGRSVSNEPRGFTRQSRYELEGQSENAKLNRRNTPDPYRSGADHRERREPHRFHDTPLRGQEPGHFDFGRHEPYYTDESVGAPWSNRDPFDSERLLDTGLRARGRIRPNDPGLRRRQQNSGLGGNQGYRRHSHQHGDHHAPNGDGFMGDLTPEDTPVHFRTANLTNATWKPAPGYREGVDRLVSDHILGHAVRVPEVVTACRKPCGPETVSIISNDSRGSERSTLQEDMIHTNENHQRRDVQASNPRSERLAAQSFSKPPIREEPTICMDRSENDMRAWKVHGSPKATKYPTFNYGSRDSEVKVHILVTTVETHESNPLVTNLMMEDYAYTAFPFNAQHLVLHRDLEALARTVSQMFQKQHKDVRSRIEFIDHDDFVVGKPLLLVVGTLDEHLSKKRETRETIGSVVTVVAGPFKGSKGIIQAIRDRKVLLMMSADGSNVKRWLHRSLIEVMNETKLLQEMERIRPYHDVESRFRENRSTAIDGEPDGDSLDDMNLNLSTSFDSEDYFLVDNDKLVTPGPPDSGYSSSPPVQEAAKIKNGNGDVNQGSSPASLPTTSSSKSSEMNK